MAPTNLLKRAPAGGDDPSKPARHAHRGLLIETGGIVVRARVLATPTGDRLWAALPIRATAQRWGDTVYLRTPIETGRERSARRNAVPGQIFFWVEQDCVLIPFGATPLSRPGEMRLPSPCNVWAEAIDDVAALAAVRPGQSITLRKA